MLQSSRTITVATPSGSHIFRWRVGSGKGRLIGNSGPGLTLTVQANGPHGGIFQMHLFSKTFQAMDEYNQEHGRHTASLTPKDVKKAIEYALEKGWDPNDKRRRLFTPKGPLDLTEYELPEGER